VKAFLARTFLERGAGFHFTEPPPTDIADPSNLSSADPWQAVACCLANLQQGRFDIADMPLELLRRHRDIELWGACSYMIGYAGPITTVKRMVAELSSVDDDECRFFVVNAAVASGGLWAIEPVLSIYSEVNADDVRILIQTELSWLLEEGQGEIWAGPQQQVISPDAPYLSPEEVPDVDGYLALVRKRAAVLRATMQSEDQAFAEGRPVDLRQTTRALLWHVCNDVHSPRIENGRMLLEAHTGIDLRSFFDGKSMLRPLAAAAILEDLLDDTEFGRSRVGERRFFGHRVPA